MLSAVLILSALVSAAVASPVRVISAAGPVAVALEGKHLGMTPVRTGDLEAGEHLLAFRSSPWGPVAFSEVVNVPDGGLLEVEVDLPARKIRIRALGEGDEPAMSPAAPIARPAAARGGEATAVAAGQAVTREATDSLEAFPLGDLFVTSSPPGGEVFLDGISMDMKTPAHLQGLPAGVHVVEVRTPCARVSSEAEVRADVITRLELLLVEGVGHLLVYSEPPGATLRMGDQEFTTPADLRDLECGDHPVVLRAPGHAEVRQDLTVTAYDTTQVDITLPEEAFGVISVAPVPLDAMVELDGIPLGEGPRTVEQVAAGTHTLTVWAAGYSTERREILVEEDQTLRVDVELVPGSRLGSLPWGRLTLNTAVTGAAVGLGFTALSAYDDAQVAHERFKAATSDEEAVNVYNYQVVPHSRAAKLRGAGAGALLVGSAILWVTTDFQVAPTPGGVAVAGRW